MKNKTIILLFTLLLAVGCSQTSEPKYEQPNFKEINQANFELITDELVGLNRIEDLFEYKDYLIVCAYHNPSTTFLHIYDKKSGELIADTFYRGRGPHEYYLLRPLFLDAESGILTAYDNTNSELRRKFVIQIDSLLKNGVETISIQMDSTYKFTCYTYEDYDKRLVFNNFSPKFEHRGDSSRLVLINYNSFEKFIDNDFPQIDDPMVRWTLYNEAKFAVDPKGEKFAIATSYGAILELFYIKETLRRSATKYILKPEILPENGALHRNDKTIYAFDDLFATEKYLYGVYDGEVLLKANYQKPIEERDEICKKIVIFDWEGNALKQINTDYRMSVITVNESEGIVYSVVCDKYQRNYLAKLKL